MNAVLAYSSEGEPFVVALNQQPQDQYFATLSEWQKQGKLQHLVANYSLYSDISTRVLNSLALLAPAISPHSQHEAFLELSPSNLKNCGKVFGNKFDDIENNKLHSIVAHKLRNTIKQWLGISISIGIAPNKSLAKVASYAAADFKRHQGVLDISEKTQRNTILANTPISMVGGISKKDERRLSNAFIDTALELSQASNQQLKRYCSVVTQEIAFELSGHSVKAPTIKVPATKANSTEELGRYKAKTETKLRYQVNTNHLDEIKKALKLQLNIAS